MDFNRKVFFPPSGTSHFFGFPLLFIGSWHQNIGSMVLRSLENLFRLLSWRLQGVEVTIRRSQSALSRSITHGFGLGSLRYARSCCAPVNLRSFASGVLGLQPGGSHPEPEPGPAPSPALDFCWFFNTETTWGDWKHEESWWHSRASWRTGARRCALSLMMGGEMRSSAAPQ